MKTMSVTLAVKPKRQIKLLPAKGGEEEKAGNKKPMKKNQSS